MVPYLQPSGQAMVDLKLWFQSDLLRQMRFVTDHTTKLGMKDLLKAQQW